MTDLKTETVSVIIPVYRVENYLDKCIQSVVDQTYKKLEIILVDDGSPDSCGAICDAWAEVDHRIKIIHQKNKGLAAARNSGLDVASGYYIMFIDSDDYISLDMITKLHSQLINDQAEIAISGYKRVDEKGRFMSNGESIETGIVDKRTVMKYLIDERLVYSVVWNKLYKHSLWLNVRFPVGKWYEDTYIMHTICFQSKVITQVSDYLYYYRIRKESITTQHSSISTLDNFEGFYNRIKFYEKNNLNDILAENKNEFLSKFLRIRKEIHINTKEERDKYRQVKKMVLYIAENNGKNINVFYKILYMMPRFVGVPTIMSRLYKILNNMIRAS